MQPGITIKRVSYTIDLPDVDALEARMFRLGGPDMKTRPKVFAALPEAEVKYEVSALAGTITRTLYHRRKLLRIAREAHDRHDAHKSSIVYDQISHFIAFEASGALTAARTFVDGVWYLARRRAGVSINEVEGDGITRTFKNPDASGYALPEVELLRTKHEKWFVALNEYRNVVIHVGGSEHMAFCPIGVLPLDLDPRVHVMNVPDRDSIHVEYEPKPGKKKRRLARPHEWRYTKGERLETVMNETWDGLKTFAVDVGKLWGLSLPPPGKQDIHDAVVLRP